jgi:hypothetical protein
MEKSHRFSFVYAKFLAEKTKFCKRVGFKNDEEVERQIVEM